MLTIENLLIAAGLCAGASLVLVAVVTVIAVMLGVHKELTRKERNRRNDS